MTDTTPAPSEPVADPVQRTARPYAWKCSTCANTSDCEGAAVQQSSGMQTTEEMAAERYRVVRTAFWWRVKIGDGQQTVGRCYTEAEAERMAAALRTAFLDGAFVVAQQVAEEQRLRDAIKGLGQLVREQSRSRITPAPHA